LRIGPKPPSTHRALDPFEAAERSGHHYDSHDQLRQHLGDFVVAYNCG
jgi:hypothetical protein